jgi:transcription termination/antitermination protein NusG
LDLYQRARLIDCIQSTLNSSDRCIDMTDEKNWFVFYTKSRHEKKVHDLLTRRGYDVFLPLQKIMRQWSDRKKKVEVPLFNSYIFVSVFVHQIQDVLKEPGVVRSIRDNGRPAILHTNEYQIINRFLETGLLLETMTTHLVKGDKVVVMDGPLKGIEGSVLRHASGNKFGVLLEALNQTILADLDPGLLKKIE